jgi:hypothetical protein
MEEIHMSKTTKPEIGLPPYYIHAENRIKELGLAIARNAHQARTPSQRNQIVEWAREITLQIAIIETLEQPTITPEEKEEAERIYETIKRSQEVKAWRAKVTP